MGRARAGNLRRALPYLAALREGRSGGQPRTRPPPRGAHARSAPLFTGIAVATLALGIGANTAIFSFVQGVLLAPLPYPEPERLVTVWENHTARGGPEQEWTGLAALEDWQAESRAFAGLAGFSGWQPNLTGAGEAERLPGLQVSDEYFQVLGIEPARGRAFAPAEGRSGAPRVVILTHELWRRRFGGDPRLLGGTIALNGEPHTVVGILAPGAEAPIGTTAEVFRPLRFDPAEPDYGNYYLRVIGRLREGLGAAAARDDMARVLTRIAERQPAAYRGVDALVLPLLDTVVGPAKRALLVLLAAVGLVLLIACANVAHLLLVRASARGREMAIRTALGAGRGQIVRQLLTESLLLAGAGGALGLLLGVWSIGLLRSLAPAEAPRLDGVGVDLPVFAFTLAVSVAAGLLFGLAPALQAARPDLVRSFKEGSRAAGSGRATRRLRGALVAGEVALSLTLLVAAGLLIQSFVRVLAVDPGFRPRDLLLARLALPDADYPEDAQVAAFYDQLLARLAQRPDVEAAAAVSLTPLSGSESDWNFLIEGQPLPEPGQEPATAYRAATPDYFRTMGIPMLRGRALAPEDRLGAPPVVVVNQTFAERWFAGRDPLGRRIRMGSLESEEPWSTIVGIAGDVHHRGLDQPPRDEVFLPHAQFPGRAMTLVLRAAGDPLALIPAVRAEVRALDRNVPVAEPEVMAEVVSSSVATSRFTTALLLAFAAIALLLAAVGIYGVTAYTVAQRAQEIGVRMALGADRRRVLVLVVRQGMAPILAGIAAGLAGAFAATRALSSMLFEVSPQDPRTFAGVALLLAAVALLANVLPAREATEVQPVVALRNE